MLEILIAGALVAFCGAAFFRLYVGVQRRTRGAHAQMRLSSFSAAIALYKSNWSAIPIGSNADMIRALCSEQRHGSCLVVAKEKMNKKGEALDAWDIPYKYICPVGKDRDRYVLYSFGPNRKDEKGDGDDIRAR